MRYIGNKTKLLPFIGSVLDRLGLTSGRAADPFAGTASVAQYLKGRHFATASSDIMTYSYVLQRAYVQLDSIPTFARVLREDSDLADVRRRRDFQAAVASRFHTQADLFTVASYEEANGLRQVLVFLDSYLSPLRSFMTREYSAEAQAPDDAARMFFTASNARRIDAIRSQLHEWLLARLLSEDEHYLLLTCLLEAADAVANTTGVYAAFVKSWQSNALKPLRLAEPELVTNTRLNCHAHLEDANQFVRKLGHVDVAYLDPPYNTRQYSSYYHVPELIALGWFDEEPKLRGKTGLIPDDDKKSPWSVSGDCVAVFRDLIANLDATYVLLSYNSEGIIPADAVESVFREFGRPDTFSRFAVDYARYRSDKDHEKRNYKADRVTEYVFAVQLDCGMRARGRAGA